MYRDAGKEAGYVRLQDTRNFWPWVSRVAETWMEGGGMDHPPYPLGDEETVAVVLHSQPGITNITQNKCVRLFNLNLLNNNCNIYLISGLKLTDAEITFTKFHTKAFIEYMM